MKTYLLKENGKDGFDYFLTVSTDRKKITLALTGGNVAEGWRDQVSASVVDHGNGLTVTFRRGGDIELDYSQAAELHMLLSEVARQPRMFNKYEKYRKIKP